MCFLNSIHQGLHIHYSLCSYGLQMHAVMLANIKKGAIHKGRLQNFQVFRPPFPPCPKFGLIHSTKSTQSPLLCLLLDQPPSPLCADVLYVWSQRRTKDQSYKTYVQNDLISFTITTGSHSHIVTVLPRLLPRISPLPLWMLFVK